MSWVDVLRQYRSFEAVEECVRRYWLGAETKQPKWEVLVGGPVIVEGRLTTIGDDAFIQAGDSSTHS